VIYVFKCKKCGMGEGVTQDLSKPPVCCKKVGTFVRVRGTEAMTEEDFNLQAKTLVDSLTATNKELIEAMEIITQSAVALNLGGSGYEERKKRIRQWLQIKDAK
jgi:hypothetical protein